MTAEIKSKFMIGDPKFLDEMIRKENKILLKWFMKNEQRLIENLKKDMFKRKCNIKSQKELVPKISEIPSVRNLLPRISLKLDSSSNKNVMKPIDSNTRTILYEKGLPSFWSTKNYFNSRWKRPPEDRYQFPYCTNWIYGWRLKDYTPISRPIPKEYSELRSTSSLQQNPNWYRECQIINAKDLEYLSSY